MRFSACGDQISCQLGMSGTSEFIRSRISALTDFISSDRCAVNSSNGLGGGIACACASLLMVTRYKRNRSHCQEIVVTLQTVMVQQFHALRAKIEEAALEKSGVSSVVQSAGRVSERYRRLTEGEGNRYFQLRNEEEALYFIWLRGCQLLLLRIYLCLGRSKHWCRVFSCDCFGCRAGPGTASYAASQIWDFSAATLLEPNSHLRSVGTEFIVPEMDADISWIESGVEKNLSAKIMIWFWLRMFWTSWKAINGRMFFGLYGICVRVCWSLWKRERHLVFRWLSGYANSPADFQIVIW